MKYKDTKYSKIFTNLIRSVDKSNYKLYTCKVADVNTTKNYISRGGAVGSSSGS